MKYCSHRDIKNLVDDFFDLEKGELTVEQYAKEFSDRMIFIGDTPPIKRGYTICFVKGLLVDYEVQVKKADSLDDAIVAAQNI